MIMSDDFVRWIVRCTAHFTDGNCDPKTAKAGQVFDLTEAQYKRLKQSGPNNWELIDKVIPNPYKKPKDLPTDEAELLQHGLDNVVDWRPIGHYAALLARE
jgi:hypothetical protein